MPLNPAQREAVTFGEGPAMILAGPGSGKTTVITWRIRWLIEEHGVDPARILVITFTRAAAKEMEERFLRLMEGERLPVSFGTFHAIFFKILKLAYNYSSRNILPQEKKREILKEAVANSEMETEDLSEFLQALSNEISEVKGEGIDPARYYSRNCPDEIFREIYAEYNEKLRLGNWVDFDDMVVLCNELFAARPDILSAWQRKYQYILIDEFQDINRLQYQVVRRLAEPENNLFVVGDDDQSIYRFRGARPEIMLGFPKDYPDCRRIVLDVNYRSTPEIIQTAGLVIGQNEARFRKDLRTENPDGPKPVFREFSTVITQNDQILRDLQDHHREGIPYEEMALLYRTNQAPRAMVEQLIRMNLPFHMRDVVPNLYDHWITGDILTYMFLGAGSRRRADFLRVINRPKRYISRSAFPDPEVDLAKLRETYRDREYVVDKLDRLEYDLRMIGKMAPYAAVNYIRRGVGYEDFLQTYAEDRKMSPDELFGILDELQESAGNYQTLADWLAYMEEYRKELGEKRQERQQAATGVTVSTMHGAKGLEYQVVILPDVNEGLVPHRRAVVREDIEEERRLFYVAMTRAGTWLHIYWTKERYNKELPPSRFLREAGAKLPVSREKNGRLQRVRSDSGRYRGESL